MQHNIEEDDDEEGEDEEDEDEPSGTAQAAAGGNDSDEELADDPLAFKAKKKPAKPAAKRKAPQARDHSPMSISSHHASSPPPQPPSAETPPAPSQLEQTSIPQPLLIRLLHEHFADKQTKIDKHAIQVLQKYVEVFVREAIARTALQKQEAAQRGEVEGTDAKWLELEDLEKVAPGMMLDF